MDRVENERGGERRSMPVRGFVDPPWDDPLDVAAMVRAMPAQACIKGMFPAAILADAQKIGLDLHPPRDRYLAFLDYPLKEHIELLARAAETFYPELSLRHGLRKLGRGAIQTFLQTTIGRVVMQPDVSIGERLERVARAYEIALKRRALDVVSVTADEIRLRFTDIHFLDSHQVGLVESVFRETGLDVTIRVASETPVTGEFLCVWK
jgi:uncharacterized protein (TIGR02265 family)